MTDPLVPADVDLRDFAFMPLDVVRLRDSDLAALESPDACWAAVLLWCASWHQVPAASIPKDDRVLANLAGFGRVVKEWMRVRDGALRGWIECSDGRLYHPVVAEKALQAWREKQAQRWRTECARVKKHNQRHNTNHAVPDFDVWLSLGCPQGQMLPVPKTEPPCPDNVPRETASKGQGEGQGQGQGDLRKETALAPNAPEPPAPAPAGKPAAKRGTRLPADWTLTVALAREGAAAREAAGLPPLTEVELRAEGASFRDYWHAKSGMDATKTDWTATWRNWCRKAKSGARPAAPPIRESTSKSAEELGL